jgi:hypothetical protein
MKPLSVPGNQRAVTSSAARDAVAVLAITRRRAGAVATIALIGDRARAPAIRRGAGREPRTVAPFIAIIRFVQS